MGQARNRWILVVVALAIGLVAGAVSTAGAIVADWDTQVSTNRGGDSNVLLDVSCASASRCVAVGGYRDLRMPATLPSGTLIETWANSKWTTNASPGQGGVSRLDGVSCPTTTRCYAVGESHSSTGPLIVTSAGGAWTSVTPPGGADPGDLFGIDCADETHCVAVGTRSPNADGVMILSLTGSTWTVMPVPSLPGGSRLLDVSCPTTTRCVAVGYRIGTGGIPRTVALHLQGGTWTKVTTPNRANSDNRLESVSCTSTSRCLAVGSRLTTGGSRRVLSLAWANATWTLELDDSSGMSFGVDCLVASHCFVVGEDGSRHPVIQERAGSSAARTSFAKLSGLSGVDCISTRVCVAVGDQNTNDLFVSKTFVLRSH